MKREEVRDEILQIKSPHILAELPTGFGKSKVAIDLIKHYISKGEFKEPSILIVVPRLVLIENWKDELKKWGYSKLDNVTFVTYVSLPKKAGKWDIVIFDEVHHLSARCREALEKFKIRKAIMLSATVGRDMKKSLIDLFPDLYIYKVSTKQAIDEEILPDPRVYLIPLILNNSIANFEIVKNKSQKIELTVPYAQRFNYAKIKNRKIIIRCTQRQYYNDMSSMIDWYKRKSFSNKAMKNLFLRRSGERLKWLSDQKTAYVKALLDNLSSQRTLTFCNGISHTEELGRYCINSKNKKASDENLHRFNEGEVDHITACNMLDEGMNLVNCRVGVYATLNSSERMIKQKLGRLLRHPSPIIVIPYFKATRDEEIVKTMLEDYNPELVSTITSLTELQL